MPWRALLVLLTVAAAPGVASAATKPKVGYLGADLRAVQGPAVEAVDNGATTGVASVSTVQAVAIPRDAVVRHSSGRLCASESCAGSVAASTGVEYLIRADVRRSGQSDYAIALDLIRVAPFAVVVVGEDKCASCVPEKLRRRVELAVSALVARLLESLEEKPVIAAADEPAARPAGAPSTSEALPATNAAFDAGTSSSSASLVQPWWRHGWVPWAAAGTAAVAMGGAVILWSKADEGSCSPESGWRQCPRVYDTKPLAIGLGGVGALALAGGVWAFIEQRQHGRELAIAPWVNGVLVRGSF